MATLISTAKSEGSLTVYTAIQTDQAQPWVDQFTKKYGIKVNIQRLSSAEVGTTFQTQAQAGKVNADVLETSDLSTLERFRKQGWMAKYTPEAADLYPTDRVVADYFYPLYQSNGAIAWNTKVVPASVQKKLEANPYQGLLEPALKGKIVLIDPANGGSGMAYYANLTNNLADQYGWDYLNKLAKQEPAVSESIAAISQEVSAGTYWATDFGDEAIFGPLAASGAPLRFASLPTMNATQFMQAIPTDAPHPAAARLFSEWSASLQGQEAMTASTGGESSAKGWKDNVEYAKKLSWYKPPTTSWLDWRTDPQLQGDNLSTYVEKWNSIFHVSS